MDIQLKYPFEEVNVTVDCGGGRVNGPKVNIGIVNGAVDANKSDVRITGEYHLHPFRATASPEREERLCAVLACVAARLAAVYMQDQDQERRLMAKSLAEGLEWFAKDKSLVDDVVDALESEG